MSLGCDHNVKSGPPGFPSGVQRMGYDNILSPRHAIGQQSLTRKSAASLRTTCGPGRRVP